MTTSAARPCVRPLAAAGGSPAEDSPSPASARAIAVAAGFATPWATGRPRPPASRLLARLSVLLVLLALMSGCAAGTEQETPSAAAEATRSAPLSDSAPPPGSAPTSPSPSSSTPPSPTVRTIDVSYAGGEVGGTTGREEVALGEQVVLRLTSDVADEVHVHGYDLSQALPAGVPVEIPLTASIPGGYEVELHDAGLALFQLRVA